MSTMSQDGKKRHNAQLFRCDAFSLGLCFLFVLNELPVSGEQKFQDFQDIIKDKIQREKSTPQIIKKWENIIEKPFFQFLKALLNQQHPKNRIDVISATQFLKHYFIYRRSMQKTNNFIKQEITKSKERWRYLTRKRIDERGERITHVINLKNDPTFEYHSVVGNRNIYPRVKGVEYIACPRPSQQEVSIYKLEAGFIKIKNLQMQVYRRMSVVSLTTGRIHFMGGNKNMRTKDVHYCIKDLSSRPMNEDEKKLLRLETQEEGVDEEEEEKQKKEKKEKEPLLKIEEESEMKSEEDYDQFKEEQDNMMDDSLPSHISAERMKLIEEFNNPIDNYQPPDFNPLSEKEAKIQKEVQKEIKIMKKKRALLPQVLEFREQVIKQSLPDGGFEDAKLVADDVYIYAIGGYHQSYGLGYCRRYRHTDDHWMRGLVKDSEMDEFQIFEELKEEDQNYEIIRMLYPNLTGISVCRVADKWIYSFGGTQYQSMACEPEPPLNHKFKVQVQLSSKIQRIDTTQWGRGECRWQEINIEADSAYFPRISHCASTHVPGTDYVIIWGGDYEQTGNIGREYIAVNLKLGLSQIYQENMDKLSMRARESRQSEGIEYIQGNQTTRQSTAVSPGYFVQNKLYAVFSKYSLNLDESVVSIGSKFEWTSPYTEFASLDVVEE